MRGLRAQCQSSDRPAHSRRGEPGHLQGDRRGRLADLGVGTTHDPGEADRAVLGVADEQVVAGQRALGVVERGQRLAGLRHADAEPATSKRLEVVRVVRLAQLEHHVVADVDDVVDRAHAGSAEPFGHPWRRRPDRDARQHGRGEPSAAVVVDDVDGRRQCRVACRAQRRRVGRTERGRQLGGEVAGDAYVGLAVRAVARDVDIEDQVVTPAQHLAVGHAERGVGRQHEDARVIVAELELARRAEHPVRVDAEDRPAGERAAVGQLGADRRERHDIARSEVEGTAPHVALAPVARVDPHALHLGRLRRHLDAHDTRGDDTGDTAGVGELVDRQAEHGQRLAEHIDVDGIVELDVLAQP